MPKDKLLGRCREATQHFLLPPPASVRCNLLQPSAAVSGIFHSWSTSHFSLSSAAYIDLPWPVCLSSHDAASWGLTSFRPCKTPAKIQGLEGDRSYPMIWGHRAIVCRAGSCAVLLPFIQLFFQNTKNLCSGVQVFFQYPFHLHLYSGHRQIPPVSVTDPRGLFCSGKC